MPSPTKPPGQRLELEVRLAGRLSENEVDTVTALIVDAFGGVFRALLHLISL